MSSIEQNPPLDKSNNNIAPSLLTIKSRLLKDIISRIFNQQSDVVKQFLYFSLEIMRRTNCKIFKVGKGFPAFKTFS